MKNSPEFLLTGGRSGVLCLWKIDEMIKSHQQGDVMMFDGKKIEKQKIVVNEKVMLSSRCDLDDKDLMFSDHICLIYFYFRYGSYRNK